MGWTGLEQETEGKPEEGHIGDTIERSLVLSGRWYNGEVVSTESGDAFSFRHEFNKKLEVDDPLGEGGMLSMRLLVDE